ncbi:unnamed protein product, partial [Allacma fusca]
MCWANIISLPLVNDFHLLEVPLSPHLPICLDLVNVSNPQTVEPTNPDSHNEALIEAVKTAARDCGMLRKYYTGGNSSKDKPWYNQECRISRRAVTQKLKLFRQNYQNQELRNEYLEAKKVHKNLIKDKKKHYAEVLK